MLDELPERRLRPFDQRQTRQLTIDEVDATEFRNSRHSMLGMPLLL
jgi:hypothetical protein